MRDVFLLTVHLMVTLVIRINPVKRRLEPRNIRDVIRQESACPQRHTIRCADVATWLLYRQQWSAADPGPQDPAPYAGVLRCNGEPTT